MESNLMNSKRTTSDDYQNDAMRNHSMRNGKIYYRFLIASCDAGAIIGRGGKTIQGLRHKHQCQIQMADCEVPERVLIINGNQSDVLSCMSDILSCIAESHQRSRKPDQNEVRALIHQSQAGALIGKGASRIKELREKHNINVRVYPQCCPGGSTERCISMRGNNDDVIRCLAEVYSILENVPPRAPYRYYDPSTYNGYNVTDYGGYTDNSSGNDQSKSRMKNSDEYTHSPYYSNPQYERSHEDRNYGSNRNRAEGYTRPYPQHETITTTLVTIPAKLAGVIIGSRGSKISQIRHESGASIKIDSEPLPGTNDRLITIGGNPDQIQQAQYLLQQTVRHSGLWNE